MEHFSPEHLAVFLLAGFSGLDFLQRGVNRLRALVEQFKFISHG